MGANLFTSIGTYSWASQIECHYMQRHGTDYYYLTLEALEEKH